MAEINSLATFIQSGVDNSITYYNMSYLSKIKDNDDSIELSTSIIYDYITELRAMCKTILLTDVEYLKYEYKPELLAYDVYGNVELAFIILILNGLSSPKEFNIKKIKLLTVTDCIDSLNTIYNAEEDLLIKNRNSIEEE